MTTTGTTTTTARTTTADALNDRAPARPGGRARRNLTGPSASRISRPAGASCSRCFARSWDALSSDTALPGTHKALRDRAADTRLTLERKLGDPLWHLTRLRAA